MSPEVLEEAVMYPTREVELKISKRNIMNVDVPRIDYEEKARRAYPHTLTVLCQPLLSWMGP